MMQGLHHQQQQLAALISAALPKDASSTLPSTATTAAAATSSATSSSAATTAAAKAASSDEDANSSRLAAITSLHRAILYPPNSLLVSHSSTFLSQGFCQLLSDKSFVVRQSAATAYGALCAVVYSIPNGRQNHAMVESIVDRFMAWTLPLLTNISASDGTTELKVEALREFLSVGDPVGIERYVLPILKACQELLEDERTSLILLHRILGLLTLISLKFSRVFQPHFLDIVDVLLGWVFVPDLGESDRHVIMDSFLQFQKHWVGNLQFSLGLLSKFLGDMDVLLQDNSHGTPPQFRRLLALLSCFSTVLQSTASGLLEMNLLEQISESLGKMLPRLLGCLLLVGGKFGWSKWNSDLWKCLTLLAEIFGESFSAFYPLVVDILFQSLEMRGSTRPEAEKINPSRVHGVLKTNLQLLSLQKRGLLPSSVQKVLQFNAPISQLRLHPNHLVTGSAAATYIFLLQHGTDEVVQQVLNLLIEELEFLMGMLQKGLAVGDEVSCISDSKSYSKFELFALMKFDLKVLLVCISFNGDGSFINQPETAAIYLKRSEKLVSFLIEKLDPFSLPIQAYVDLQVNVIKTMQKLTAVEFLSRCSMRSQTVKTSFEDASVTAEKVDDFNTLRDGLSTLIDEHMRKYSVFIVKALHVSSPLAVKLIALQWIQRFSEDLIALHEKINSKTDFYNAFGFIESIGNILLSIFYAASDGERKVRLHSALILEAMLQARLIDPVCFYAVSEVVLEKLGDPDVDIKNSFVRLLSHVLPTTIYACGSSDCQGFIPYRSHALSAGTNTNLLWKQVFALKQLPQQVQSQQLVSILSYISQRWKVPLSSWIQRLIHSCRCAKDLSLGQLEDAQKFAANAQWLDIKVDEDILDRVCSVNNLAGGWWAIHEAARFCISTRLRTNLGGPTQTFAALERMLLDIAHVLQLDTEQNDGNLSIIGSSGARLLPMRLLLDFVEALKKNVYNAYEGSAALPSATRQSCLFFRANRKVCEEWFSRICEPMMNVGLALQCHDATIQYCSLRLQELKNLSASYLKDKPKAHASENLHNMKDRFSGDVMRVLRHIALALCNNHESKSLIGLQQWASMTFSCFLTDENQSLSHGETLGPLAWITGLVYQAEGKYEKAAAHFIHLLQNEESLSSMGSDNIQFAIARIIESYTAVSDWRSLESWLSELQTLRSRHAGKNYSGALTTTNNEINAIHALARFDDNDFQGAWACLDLTPKSSSELTLDPKLALRRSEQMLLQGVLFLVEGKLDEVPNEINKAKSMLEEILSVLPLDGLVEAAPFATQLHCIFAIEEALSQKLKGIHDNSKQYQSMLTSFVESKNSIINRIHQDCSSWLKVLRVYRTSFPTSPATPKLCLSLSSLSRKQGNLMLAHRLDNYLRDQFISHSEVLSHDFLLANLQYEGFLLMHAENKFEGAFANLWSFVRPYMVSSSSIVSGSDDAILKAKACLKLSKWLRLDYPDVSLADIVLKMHEDFNTDEVSSISRGGPLLNEKPTSQVIIEEMVGTATKLSTQLCSTMGKSWISYASWCFCQARDSLFTPRDSVLRSCSFSSMLLPEILPERFKLTDDERGIVQSIVWRVCQKGIDGEDQKCWLDSVQHSKNNTPVVQQVLEIMETVAGAPGAEVSNGESLSVTLASQLRTSLLFANGDLEETDLSSAIDDLVNVWWSLRRRRVSLFGHAAHGFMQYLTYSSAKVPDFQLGGSESKQLKQKNGSYTLRATLYFLHIVLNYAVELGDIIEPALSTIPLLPWQEVTPQLFARISSHPEQVVRKQLQGLLMMLAKLSPWSIVYPTLVDVNANEEKLSDELQHILGCLRELYPRLVHDVQLMINELGNVTVLWEELWLSTLQDLHADVMRRIHLLKEEAARIAENSTLSQSEKDKINASKYSAMMAPIVVALERRLASTSRKPETPHEIWFCEGYRERLRSAILAFKLPPASGAALGDIWRPFDEIASSLVSYQRKSSISLGEVAPQLALLSSSDVPMPGLEKQIAVSDTDRNLSSTLQGIVTIASFSEHVIVLSTKTKPKKLAILGSDGKKYTYLLKGREDLRLDARIMQLLQAINGFLHSFSATRRHSLDIRYYSVTPISGRAGLIQWVDNVIGIYSVFKDWQNRVQVAQLSAMGPGSAKNSVPPSVPRPSDMFYGKIIPALKEKGIRRVISRRDWPHDVKRKVLLDLMKEVPTQLLHQELWCASEGFKAFSSKLRRYSGSVATMSMVGHILGLGDRHLDNILVDFSSGDIVHIDYNVCFDKGKRLKIPEIVPFRLTPIVEAALGLTGIEGAFRENCEAVLGVLRENKDVLLMLLEVFVWDPLVEWTREDFHDEAAIGGEERKGMELAVSLSLFASRVQEIRVPLQEHHDVLLTTLPAVESALERFADVLNQYELASAVFYRADQERSRLILHEASAKSIVAEATSKSEKTRVSYEHQAREFAQTKSVIAEKAQDASKWMEQHGRILDALRSNSLPDINFITRLSSMADTLSLTHAVLVAGVPLTIVPEPTQAQCQDIDREVSQLITELDHGLSSAITGIQTYSLALQRILPLNYVTTSAVHGWMQVLQLSSNVVSSDILSLARRQAAELIAKAHGNNLESVAQVHDDLCFKVEKYTTDIGKFEQECAELVNSIGSETESKAKDRLLSTFLKYMQVAGFSRKEDSSNQHGQLKYDLARDAKVPGELDDKKEKVLSILNKAVNFLYNEVKHRVFNIFSNSAGGRNANDRYGTIFCEFEEQVQKCTLVSGFICELQQYLGKDIPSLDTDAYHARFNSETNWASVFKTTLLSCKSFVSQMTEVLLDAMKSAISLNSDVMDAFGIVSQIRGSVETALDQLLEIELERRSLVELEKNYFVKVGLITEQQLALEEATMNGRDHLSWEEAEELASQEEACRAQLDHLHQSWNQREMRTSSLIRRESDIRNALVSAENHFQTLITAEELGEPHVLGSKALLAKLLKPFSELESLNKVLSTSGGFLASHSNQFPNLADFMSYGYPLSEHIWKFDSLLNNHAFFVWKVFVVDSFLDSCVHDAASSVDQNLGFDQLYNVVKKKLEIQLQQHVGQYLKDQIAPAFLAWLDKESGHLNQLTEAAEELSLDPVNKDIGSVRKVQLMLEEYCNAHETVRAARSAASVMKRQVNELKEALHKTCLEIVQLEWVYDALNPSHKSKVTFQKFLAAEDSLHSLIPNLSRPKLLEVLQSSVTKMTRSMDSLQVCERSSIAAEGQLERAMGWACGGPNSGTTGNNSTKVSGIPPEFHNHLIRRRQLVWEAREKASSVVNICMSVLEFEASRDGIFRIPGEVFPLVTGGEGRIWQQAYLNALTKLEAAYHSFARAEQEWKLAQSSVEAASSSLYSATNELSAASLKAKLTSGDLQSIVLAMKDSAYEVSVALSNFVRISKSHTALTSESGTMLEEVLAITEDLHDVHKSGKEAAAVHHYLLGDLSKANAVLLPLESVLSNDVAAMTDAMTQEKDTKMEVSPIHGQAIYQSYRLKIKEAIQMFNPLVPSLTRSVKGLYSMLTKLARTASLHAGNLHKALEGLADSEEVKSQEIIISRSDLDNGANEFDNKGSQSLSRSDSGSINDFLGDIEPSLQDKGWISPPDSMYSSSAESGSTSAEASLPGSFNDPAEATGQLLQESNTGDENDPNYVPSPEMDSRGVANSSQSMDQVEEVNNSDGNSSTIASGLNEHPNSSPSPSPTPTPTPTTEALTVPAESSQPPNEDSLGTKLERTKRVSSSSSVRIEDENQEAPHPNSHAGSRVARGRNAYAMSVLRRVEMKIDGRDIADNRKVNINEQVDYLLKQAMSIDNLCNMYEGWTPWI